MIILFHSRCLSASLCIRELNLRMSGLVTLQQIGQFVTYTETTDSFLLMRMWRIGGFYRGFDVFARATFDKFKNSLLRSLIDSFSAEHLPVSRCMEKPVVRVAALRARWFNFTRPTAARINFSCDPNVLPRWQGRKHFWNILRRLFLTLNRGTKRQRESAIVVSRGKKMFW